MEKRGKKIGMMFFGICLLTGCAKTPEVKKGEMNGLDKYGILQVKELLQQLKEQGKTILLSSHYAEDMEVCDEVYEMEDGYLVGRMDAADK